MDHLYAVIMAGGGGTRLWPLSRKSRPKQMLKLIGERSLFQAAVERLDPLIPPKQIYVVTIEEQAERLKLQAPSIPSENFILEPMPKGTASVVGIGAALLQELDEESVMAVLTADHYIGNEEGFRAVLETAFEVAKNGELITLGIPPSYPSTGYGYIHQGDRKDEYQEKNVHEVIEFNEKPSFFVAKSYLDSGDYAWNSGMFIWRTDRILTELTRQLPELSRGLDKIVSNIGKSNYPDVFGEVWTNLVSETIDYGVMENAENVSVIPAGKINWIDIGGFDRFFELFPSDSDGNVLIGENHLLIDTRDTLIFTGKSGSQGKLVAALGLEDMIIVETEDVLLICPRERAEEVRSFVDALSEIGKDQYIS
jgi:mannose-1-phosphate guanylyltransferase